MVPHAKLANTNELKIKNKIFYVATNNSDFELS